MKNIFEKIRPAFCLIVICVVAAAALAGTNMLTKEPKAELQKKRTNEALSKILPAEDYKKCEFNYKGKTAEYYSAIDKNKATIGYIFETSSSGYGGDVAVMTALGLDGTVKRVLVTDATSETAGIGQKVTNENWLSKFKDKIGELAIGNEAPSQRIDAITGATYSSKAVVSAVNEAQKMWEKSVGGNKK